MNKKKFNFNIGADPEFSIIFGNKYISAKNLFKQKFDNKKELTRHKEFINKEFVELGYNTEKVGGFGWDSGIMDTAELRPKQESTPEKITNNIQSLLEQINNELGNFKLTTYSNQAPLGGHIHFELNDNYKINSKRKLHDIHRQMTSYYFPIMMSENEMNIKIRTIMKYGNVNSYRIHTFKTGKTYEFRIPSAEWLTTRKITESTLAYLGVVFHELTTTNRPMNKTIATTETKAQALQKIVTSQFTQLGKIFNEEIKKEIVTFEKYQDFKEEIDFILSPEKVKEEKIKNNYEITKGWNLTNKSQTKIKPQNLVLKNNIFIQEIKNNYNNSINN